MYRTSIIMRSTSYICAVIQKQQCNLERMLQNHVECLPLSNSWS